MQFKSEKLTSTKRFLLPDLLKGLAGVFMVQVHITELFIDTPGRESFAGKISLFLGGPFAAVIFMIVMGYFIYLNKHTTARNLFRGVKIFLLGFVLNLGLNLNLLLKIRFKGWQYDPLQYLFGVDILYLAGLSIILLSLIKTLKKGKEWIAIIALLLVAGLTGILNEKLLVTNHHFILPFIAGNYSWSYFPLFPWLSYPLAGFILAHFVRKIRDFSQSGRTLFIVCIALVTALIAYFGRQGVKTSIDLQAYYHHTLWFVGWALGLSALWALLLQAWLQWKPASYAGDFLQWIGKNITLFYVIQWLIIGNIATEIYQSQPLGSYWYWFGGIFAATLLFTWSGLFLWTKVFPKKNHTAV